MKLNTILKTVILIAGMGSQAMAAEDATAPAKSLYERLGGLKGITVVVDDFIDRMVANETLNSNPAIDAGRKSSPAPYLKFQVSQLVCQVTGGPCAYTGLSMKDSHATMGVTEADWEIMVGLFKQSLAKFQVPAAEQTDILVVVGSTKGDIVMAAPAEK